MQVKKGSKSTTIFFTKQYEVDRTQRTVREMASIELTEDRTSELVKDLISKRLVGWTGEKLVFLTRRCTTVFTPKNGLAAHGMDDARFAEWMTRDERSHKVSFAPPGAEASN